jgi:hypothetical protein
MYTDLRTGSQRFIIIFHHIHALNVIASKKFGGKAATENIEASLVEEEGGGKKNYFFYDV